MEIQILFRIYTTKPITQNNTPNTIRILPNMQQKTYFYRIIFCFKRNRLLQDAI